MPELEFVISGETQAAEQAAASFAALLGNADPAVRHLPSAQLAEVPDRVIDPVALAALAFAIPCGLVAALDLADRIAGKRKQAAEMVETARRARLEYHVEIFVIAVDRVSHPVADLDADKLLHIAELIERPPLPKPTDPE
jgi:hypothetical protein